jgi:putative addiction module component (TIGR02574 family)
LTVVGTGRKTRLERRLNLNPEHYRVATVPLTLEQIVEETSQLPADVVAELVDRILLARHGGIERDVEAAWKTEVHRRVEEIETGKVQGIPAEQTLARVRKIIGQ